MKTKYEISGTGFIIALLLVSMMATLFAGFLSGLESEYGINSDIDFGAYNQTADLITKTEQLEEDLKIEQEDGILDVIGGYFRSGYSALQIAFTSFSLFDNMMDNAGNDLDGWNFGLFSTYLVAIILVGLIVGVFITVLVKIRV